MGKNIALITIGCDYRSTRYALKGCINDAMDVSRTIVSLCEGGGHNVKLMLALDNGGSLIPTRSGILNLLRQTIRSCNQGKFDMLFFYFAGHGLQVPDKNGDESDRMDESILASDLNLVRDDDLFVELTRLRQGCEALFVFDCCHSGTMLDLPKIPIGGNQSAGGRMILPAQVASISACTERQKSVEKLGRGLFTSAFCSILRKRGLRSRIYPVLSTIKHYLESMRTNMTVTATCSRNVSMRRSSFISLKGGKSKSRNALGYPSNSRGLGILERDNPFQLFEQPQGNRNRHGKGNRHGKVKGKRTRNGKGNGKKTNKRVRSTTNIGGCNSPYQNNCRLSLSVRGPWKARARRGAPRLDSSGRC